ncbi:MAG: tyrosine-type recombinase/integrase [Pseudobutyrivibrio sp.]|nr:tyrosine-type recombinase/integrase [Pseudobutyrivibrio sp.]
MSKLLSNDELLIEKTNNLVETRMPSFASRFFDAQMAKLQPASLYGYAIDMAAFFEYISCNKEYSIETMTLKDFQSLSECELEDYIIESQLYDTYGEVKERSIAAIRRRYASLRTFYMYYYTESLINAIPILKVTQPAQPKIRQYIPSDAEKIELLSYIANGTLPSSRAASYQNNVRKRDTAIAVLLICAGLKASECERLNIDDLHLEEQYIIVKKRRKSKVYISPFVAIVLSNYLTERLHVVTEYMHDNALFLSIKRRRISQDAIEEFIKKYTTTLFGDEIKIAPKDLSFSYRDNIFYATKNVPLSAELCGCDPNTIFNIYKAEILEFDEGAYNFARF